MRDVQGDPDLRNIPIDRVGVRGVSYPITVLDQRDGTQATVASVSMSVLLPHQQRGTHMSRFIEVLDEFHGRLSPRAIRAVTEELRRRLEAPEASARFDFPYFIRRGAPASGRESFMRYEASFEGTSSEEGFDTVIGVVVPVQTLCPCSKAISQHGAHNQRAQVSIRVRSQGLVWFEELIEIAEGAASTPLYTLLKREDEKRVTERAYENPRFVEDLTREIALALDADGRISWYALSVSSAESIHNHDAFAELVRSTDRRDRDSRPPACPAPRS